jgi:hypothetical protein
VVHDAAGVIKACGGGTQQLDEAGADAFDSPQRTEAAAPAALPGR